MELTGRPDGDRPLRLRLAARLPRGQGPRGQGAGRLPLDSDACAALMREGVQYYHRYLAAFHLQRFDLVARDTTRNLRLFAFVVKHAADRRDKVQFDQYRPYVTMMQGPGPRRRGDGPERPRAPPSRRSTRGSRASAPSSATTTRTRTRPSAGSWPARSGSAGRSSNPPRRPGRAARAAARAGRVARRLRGGRPAPRPDRPAPRASPVTPSDADGRPGRPERSTRRFRGIGLDAGRSEATMILSGFGRTRSSAMFDRGVLLANQ